MKGTRRSAPASLVGVVVLASLAAACSGAPAISDRLPDLSGIGDVAADGLGLVARGMDLRAEEPTCAATVSPSVGLTITPGWGDLPVLACVEDAGSHVVLKLADNRAYPIVVDAPGAVSIAEASEGSLQYEVWRHLQRRFGERGVLVPGGGYAELEVVVPRGATITIESAPTSQALLVDATVLAVAAVGGGDLRTARAVGECGYEVLRQTALADQPDDRPIEGVLDVVQRCVGLVIGAGSAGAWASIRDGVRLGMAARDLISDRNAGRTTVHFEVTRPRTPAVRGQRLPSA